MSVPTNQEIVDAIDIRLYAIVNGGAIREITILGKNIRKYSIRELTELKKYYQGLISASSDTGNRTYAGFIYL